MRAIGELLYLLLCVDPVSFSLQKSPAVRAVDVLVSGLFQSFGTDQWSGSGLCLRGPSWVELVHTEGYSNSCPVACLLATYIRLTGLWRS